MSKYILLLLVSLVQAPLVAQITKPEVYFEETKEGYTFYGDNTEPIPYSIKIDFDQIKNLKASFDYQNKILVLEPNQKHIPLFKLLLTGDAKKSGARFSYGYLYSKGNSIVENDLNHEYLLPYEHSSRRKVGQGNFGSGTHKSIYAIDFDMPINTKIFASRNGIVSAVKEDSDKGGNSPKFDSYGNYIEIYHEDGTFANYVHLKQYGSIVSVGDRVEAGELIGYSGNTGWSSGPHLHFALSTYKGFENNTIPAKFLLQSGASIIPDEGRYYYAYHPGKGAFEEESASNFTEEFFEKEKLVANKNNKLEITQREYAEFILFYVDNGKGFPLKGTLQFELNNMISTKKLPFKFEVKANEKKYLLAIKPDDYTKSYGFKVSSSFKQIP